MFNTVVVGVDGGPGGRDAMALARLLLADGGTLKPAHVPVRIGRGESRSVARCLHTLVNAWDGDVLVVGSSRRGILGRTLLGDDTRSALQGAPCTVAVAPHGYASEDPVIDRIGVGYDECDESEHALTVARGVARRLGARVTAFRAVPVPAGPLSRPEADEPPVLAHGVNSEVGYGEPSVELAFFSDSVDLLVVGTHEHGPMGRLLHQDTASGLARSAGCPLLVVRD